MSTGIPDYAQRRIEELLFQGKKIEAIKVCREATGLGLKEAKETVENFEAELRQAHPDRFRKRIGCMAGIAFFVAGAAALAFPFLSR